MLTNFGHLLDRREARLFLKSLLWHPGVSRAKKSDHVGQWAGGGVTSSPTTHHGTMAHLPEQLTSDHTSDQSSDYDRDQINDQTSDYNSHKISDQN